ncbi:MAG: hypothetical protein ABSH47_05845 [Bryobacteraceae bacterium]|jgi:hypothetical protein
MELSAIQIVTTVVLIVAAGAVALVCDYLRNRSLQLRELAPELNVRMEMSVAAAAAPMSAPSAASAAAARRARVMATRGEKAEAAIKAPAPAVRAELPTPPAEMKMDRTERHSTEMVKPALAGAAELTSVRGAARPRRRPLPPPNAPLPRLDEMNPRQALSEWLDQRAAKAPARSTEPAKMEEFVVTEAPRPTLAIEEPAPVALMEESAPALVACTPAVEEPAPVAADDIRPAPADDIREVLRRAIAKRNVAVPVAQPAPVAVAAPAPKPVPAPAAVPAPQKTVSVFLSTRKIDTFRRDVPSEPAPQVLEIADEREVVEALVENITAAEPRFEIIDGAVSSSHPQEVALPAGMHDHAVLDRAIATGKPFRGLVVSVGVNDVEGPSTRNTDLMQSIGFFIRGLIGEKEFACRTGEAEFLIVCPGVEGSGAQRRLNQIAEQLWDYQLRGVSTWSILFSWGGAEVQHQRLAEAIAIANERMYQTRRGRKTVSVESHRPWRKVAM